jgi:hypothetical protein
MRADIHDGPEQMLQPKAGYIDARTFTASSPKSLAAHGRTIQLGQSAKSSTNQILSATHHELADYDETFSLPPVKEEAHSRTHGAAFRRSIDHSCSCS